MKEFFLRAPDLQSAITDAKNALEAGGADPFDTVLAKDAEGNTVLNETWVIAHESGRWYAEQPTDGSVGTAGDDCIINLRTESDEIAAVVESFETTDPKLDPSEVADGNKAPNGLSRIAPPATPIRPIAT